MKRYDENRFRWQRLASLVIILVAIFLLGRLILFVPW